MREWHSLRLLCLHPNDTRETLPQGCILLSASSDVQSDSPLLGSTVVLREEGTLWILA